MNDNKVPYENEDDNDDLDDRELRDKKQKRPRSFKQAERRRRVHYEED